MIVIRIILLLLPLFGLFYYLRWRYRLKLTGETASDEELKNIRMVLLAVIASLVLMGLFLRYADTSSSDSNSTYVPPHMEDGVLIPGEFKDNPDEKPVPKSEE